MKVRQGSGDAIDVPLEQEKVTVTIGSRPPTSSNRRPGLVGSSPLLAMGSTLGAFPLPSLLPAAQSVPCEARALFMVLCPTRAAAQQEAMRLRTELDEIRCWNLRAFLERWEIYGFGTVSET